MTDQWWQKPWFRRFKNQNACKSSATGNDTERL